MAKYKKYSIGQGVFLPVFFKRQILPGTFEYTLTHLIENELDTGFYGTRYKNDDRLGSSNKPVKSNITDNDSAKMKTSNGIIQGYNGVVLVDSKHQVIAGAEAFGKGPEQDLLNAAIAKFFFRFMFPSYD